ncbi:MAG: hypothetical protein Q9166_003583 [cf. Caloplaca sp. 2 TL-2023]
MPGRRVVQDSDEDDNADESPVRQSKPVPAGPFPPDVDTTPPLSSSQIKRAIPSAGPSTGSTELLNREIHNAHISLLEPSTSSRSSLPSSASSSISKWRAITAFEEEKSTKPKITYGGKKSQDDATFQINSDDEGPIRPTKRAKTTAATETRQSTGYRDKAGGDITSSGSPGALEIFGDSTGSNASGPFEEQHNHGLAASDFIMPSSKFRSPGATQHDIQSSEASRVPTTERASSPPPAANKSSSIQINIFQESQSTQAGASDFGFVSPVGSRKRKRAISEPDSAKIILGEEIPPSSSAPASSPVKRARHDSGHRFATSKPRSDLDGGHDELSLSVTSSPSSIKKQMKAGTRTSPAKADPASEPEPQHFDLIPDLPPEKYQPRPSRSRSALAVDEIVIPTDFSKRPEAITKKRNKSKRQKAAASEKPEQSIRASPRRRQAKAEVQASEEQTKIEEEQDPEKDPVILNQLDSQTSTACPVKDPFPPKKSRGRPKKGQPMEPAVDPPVTQFPSVNIDVATEISSPVKLTPAPASSKRGRKRKKTSPEKELSTAIVHDDAPSDEEQKDLEPPSKNVLTDTDPNIQHSTIETPFLQETTPKTSKAESETSHVFPKATEPPEKPTKQTPVKVEEKKPLGLAKDSPAKYRVGLSKSQRIPSLLRVVRK